MLRLSRPTTGLFAAVALLSALSAWDGCADHRDGSPLERLTALTARRPRADVKREAALQADVLGRSRRLGEVAEGARAGRLSLLDAAARVRDIESASPFFPWERFREGHPGDSDDERFCHMVIELVYQPPGRRAGPDPAVARLEADLEALRRRGPIRLP